MHRKKSRIIIISATSVTLGCLGLLFLATAISNKNSARGHQKSKVEVSAISKATAADAASYKNHASHAGNTPGTGQVLQKENMVILRQFSIESDMRIGRLNIDRAYASIFAQLNLLPDELEALKDLLVELKNARQTAELQEGSFSNSQTTKKNIENLTKRTRQEITDNMVSLLGSQRYEAFEYYENTLPQRAEVDKIGLRFSYEAEPLSSEQKELLIDILYEYSRQQGVDGVSKKKSSEQGREHLLEQASRFLSESQIRSLKKSLNVEK